MNEQNEKKRLKIEQNENLIFKLFCN